VRAAWRAEVSARLEASRLVFVDEMGTNISLSALYGWSRVGEHLRAPAGTSPEELGEEHHSAFEHEHGGYETVRGGGGSDHEGGFRGLRRADARPESLAGTGGGDGQPLRPQRSKGTGARRGSRLRTFVPAALLSPDLNPIEEAFLKVKGLMRRAEARTREALVEAMDKALCAVSAREARGFFEHSGYRVSGQPF
jgi:putative transposase